MGVARPGVRGVLGIGLSHRGADAAGLVTLAAFIGIGAVVVPASTMSPTHWLAAGLAGTALSVWLWHSRSGPKTAAGWLYLAVLSLILSTIFLGADIGLELIKPPGSRRHDAAATVGGIELHQLLCPGLTAVALAGWVRHLVARRLDPHA